MENGEWNSLINLNTSPLQGHTNDQFIEKNLASHAIESILQITAEEVIGKRNILKDS